MIALFSWFCLHCLLFSSFFNGRLWDTQGTDGPREAALESMQNQSRITRQIARQILVALAAQHNPKASAPTIGLVIQMGFGSAIDNVKLHLAAACISIMKQYRTLALPAKWITTIGIQTLRTFKSRAPC